MTISRATINRHPMRKSSPGCAVIVLAKFVKMVTGASGIEGTIGVATGDGTVPLTLFMVSLKASGGMGEIAGVGDEVCANE